MHLGIRSSVAVRFLPDGRLRLGNGVTLDRGSKWLTRSEASDAIGTADSILYRWFPESEDISGEPDRVRALLARVEAEPTEVGARLYVGAGLTIVTLEEFH
jgi:hypothetical protein